MLLEKLGNIILNTDAYKVSHYKQFPANAAQICSYIEARGGEYDYTVSFGVQAFLKEYFSKPLTHAHIDDAERYLNGFLGLDFNRKGWEYIVDKHNGYLPLEIETVAEGSVIPTGQIVTQITNTDPNCAWLPSYIETSLLRATWYCNTVATKSLYTKEIIKKHMLDTCDDLTKLPFMLNDFGARAASSSESSGLGGMAHLVNFSGSDTVMGIVASHLFYDYQPEKQGVPAAEHSTITSWGKDGETAAYRNMVKQFAGNGKIVSVVSDSYDLWNAIGTIWGEELKDEVINNGGTVVIRPDSGDPVTVVCRALELLEEKFGTTLNGKGFKLLPPYIRLIQGDGVNPASIDAILTAMKRKGFSADNICFGMGGELLQKLDRDTQKYAMKASAIRLAELEEEFETFMETHHQTAFLNAGNWRDVFKDPVTDPGKSSKRGVNALVFDENKGYITLRRAELNGRENLLRTVYRNGVLMNETKMDIVRAHVVPSMERFHRHQEMQRKTPPASPLSLVA